MSPKEWKPGEREAYEAAVHKALYEDRVSAEKVLQKCHSVERLRLIGYEPPSPQNRYQSPAFKEFRRNIRDDSKKSDLLEPLRIYRTVVSLFADRKDTWSCHESQVEGLDKLNNAAGKLLQQQAAEKRSSATPEYEQLVLDLWNTQRE